MPKHGIYFFREGIFVVKILVSGKCKKSGKTTLIERIINNLRGKIYVVKSSIHDRFDKFELIDDKDVIIEKNTDTAIFSKAGADKVYYLKSNNDQLQQGIEEEFKKIKGYDYLIVEGNSIIDYVGFNLVYYLDKEGGDIKQSAIKCKAKADIILEVDHDFEVKFNKKEISCFKAHVIGNSLGIPLIKVGKMLDEAQLKIKNCQLGLF